MGRLGLAIALCLGACLYSPAGELQDQIDDLEQPCELQTCVHSLSRWKIRVLQCTDRPQLLRSDRNCLGCSRVFTSARLRRRCQHDIANTPCGRVLEGFAPASCLSDYAVPPEYRSDPLSLYRAVAAEVLQ